MDIVLGGTGHVGSAAAKALIGAGGAVTIVTRVPAQAEPWRRLGAEVEGVDILDTPALHRVFRRGRRALVLNPPADPSTDTDVEERRTVAAIIAALEDSGLEKIVAVSTYGAQPGERCGDLSVLWDLEQELIATGIPVAINRGAYYFTNWDPALAAARDEGVLESMLPADLVLPMVAPRDLGVAAARRLRSPVDDVGIDHVEGPSRHSPNDVAAAFAAALGRDVVVSAVPRDAWEATFRKIGFSDAAAASYTRMTEVTVDGDSKLPDDPVRGPTTLQEHVDELAATSAG